MRKFILFILLVITLPSFGQSLKNLKVFCTDNFNPKASITVQGPTRDYIGIADMLKNNLVMNNFKVISEAVAKQRIELSNKKQFTDSTFNQNASLGKTTYVNSLYVITFTYDYYEEAMGTYLTGLNGQVVDLSSDGEIVATFSYNHGVALAKKPSKVVEALCTALKANSKK